MGGEWGKSYFKDCNQKVRGSTLKDLIAPFIVRNLSQSTLRIMQIKNEKLLKRFFYMRYWKRLILAPPPSPLPSLTTGISYARLDIQNISIVFF
jgi:hypothetical protein